MRPLSWIFAIAAVLRLVFWWGFCNQSLNIWDEREYDQLAQRLATTGEFAFEPGGALTSLRPPLYPAFVASVYAVAGVGNYAAVRLAQAVISLLTAGVLFALGRTVADRRTANWLVGIYCFYPSLLGYTNLLLTETLFTFLLTAAIYCCVRVLNRGSIIWAVATGLVLGLATLTRSILWLAPPFLAVFLVAALRIPWTNRVCGVTALLCSFAAVIAPWSIRNTHLQQTFTVVDVMGGRNFMMGNYEHTPLFRSWDAIAIESPNSWIDKVMADSTPEQRRTQGMIDKLAMRQGLAFVAENPGLTAKRDLVKFFDFWGLERELIAGAGRGYFGDWPPSLLILSAYAICGAYATVLLLGIFGALVIGLPDARVSWLLSCVIAFVCGLHTITFGHSRYHLPLMPLIMIFAAQAIVHRDEIWRRRSTPTFAVATLLCGVFVASWMWLFMAVDRNLIPSTSLF